jgi:hypothetical protein
MSSEAMHLDTDLSGIKDPNDPAPEGQYHVKVNSATFQESKSSGMNMAVVNLIIQNAGEHTGKFVTDYLLVGSDDERQRQQGLFRAKQYLQAGGLALNLGEWEKLTGAELDVELSVQAATESFNRETNRVRRVYT